jgi:hypothetical protein
VRLDKKWALLLENMLQYILGLSRTHLPPNAPPRILHCS